jgi:hypothetical protein
MATEYDNWIAVVLNRKPSDSGVLWMVLPFFELVYFPDLFGKAGIFGTPFCPGSVNFFFISSMALSSC